MPATIQFSEEEILEALRQDAARLGRTPSAKSDWSHAARGRPSAATVRRRFGSWNAALRRAELPTNEPGSPSYWTRDRIAGAMLDWLFEYGTWPLASEWDFADPLGRWPSRWHVRAVFGGWIRAQVYAGRVVTPGLVARGRLE